ncbi:hypothetical protein M427DRAFT_220034 [Gonapodya prolifera JEL478]|uniref:Transglutaminase-like domain-containing protein n=1 Tax=Gonapodya prolifera (strain JEL478) TaxID=1344416 RepID=A0A138ZYL8_GONPJ|nr:hypothetical protein M427DRAFT_220034 [Gonapodya prolifera JEL478]|eukprot:KXS09571.1 hypothetical protein M427DRAFT_220034 [Gonapodya prolifera JEL478]
MWCGFVEGTHRFGSFPRDCVEVLDNDPAERLPEHRRLFLPQYMAGTTARIRESAHLHHTSAEKPVVKKSAPPTLPTRHVTEAHIQSYIPAVEKVRTSTVAQLEFHPRLGDVDFSKFDYTAIDQAARSVPVEATQSISGLARCLTQTVPQNAFPELPEPTASLLPLLRAVFVWAADTITYDVDIYNHGSTGPQSPDDVLRNRTAVCEGYANLLMAIFGAMGIGSDVVTKVSGCAKGVGFGAGQTEVEKDPYGQPTNHAWIVCWLNGSPRVLDATWGSGFAEQSSSGYTFKRFFNSLYFLMDPRQAIYSHFPANSSLQCLRPEVTEDDFLSLPIARPQFFKHNAVITSGRNIVTGSLIDAPENGDAFVTLYLTVPAHTGKPRVRGLMRYPLRRDQWTGKPVEGSGALSRDGVFTRYDGVGNVGSSSRIWMVSLLFRFTAWSRRSIG